MVPDVVIVPIGEGILFNSCIEYTQEYNENNEKNIKIMEADE